MNRRQALGALAGGAAATLAAQQRRPNFVILFADDMGWSDAGFNGRKDWTTPNLDRLASQGVTFNRWYTGMPLCAPSRACLLTGKYTIHHGVRNNSTDLPASETTIAEALKPLGYRTALFGKWHRGQLPGGGFTHPLDQGFDETFGYLDAKHAWEHFPKMLYRGREETQVEGFSADLLANESIRFMRANRANPFLLYVPFIEPHFLVEAPEEDVKRYAGKFREKDAKEPHNARYAAMIHRFDAAVGRILRELDALKLSDNTVVLFTSDNGATFETGSKGAPGYHDSNRPFRGQKRSLEEGGIRMPACARWPGRIAAGSRSEAVSSTIDIMPSLLAAAGGTPDPAWRVDGANMIDAWAGKSPPPERTLFWEFKTENIDMLAAMRGDMKLLQMGGNRFLYNVREDPGERRTLAAVEPEMFARLRKELDAWMATAR